MVKASNVLCVFRGAAERALAFVKGGRGRSRRWGMGGDERGGHTVKSVGLGEGKERGLVRVSEELTGVQEMGRAADLSMASANCHSGPPKWHRQISSKQQLKGMKTELTHLPSSKTLPTAIPLAGERLLFGMCSLVPLDVLHSPKVEKIDSELAANKKGSEVIRGRVLFT